jgi:sulfate adenylyltransferase
VTRMGHGLIVEAARAEELRDEARTLKSLDLRAEDLQLVELLLAGYCSPLRGFMAQADYDAVLSNMRLSTGEPWSVPITLAVDPQFAGNLDLGKRIALRDESGVLIAVLRVTEIWSPDVGAEAQALYGDPSEGGALDKQRVLLGGDIEGVELPSHYDFVLLRFTPSELKDQTAKHGWKRILAFQPEGLIHRGEIERVVHAARQADANILLQAPVTPNQAASANHYLRIRCYERALRYLPEQGTMLSLLPVPRPFTPIREIVWRAKLAGTVEARYLLLDLALQRQCNAKTWDLAYSLAHEMGVELVNLPAFHLDAARGAFVPKDPQGTEGETIVEPEDLIRRLKDGLPIPDWFSYPEVLDELRRSQPVRGRQGVTVFFTGLSGAGKSTIAHVLMTKLLELGERTVTLLDGDIVRKNLSSELGFSRAHRDLNILRIGFVASEITKHGGIAICAPIAPYQSTRRRIREMVSSHGAFVEVYVATPLDTCEKRDRKGLYARARAGLIKEFTGISDPYEAPENAEIVIDTRDCTPLEAAQSIVTYLENQCYIR